MVFQLGLDVDARGRIEARVHVLVHGLDDAVDVEPGARLRGGAHALQAIER